MIGSDARWRRWRSPVRKRLGPPGWLAGSAVTSRQVAFASKNSSAAEVGAGWGIGPPLLWIETWRLTDTRAAHFSVVSGKFLHDFSRLCLDRGCRGFEMSIRANVTNLSETKCNKINLCFYFLPAVLLIILFAPPLLWTGEVQPSLPETQINF